MRKAITILGTLIITSLILIGGSVMAAWVYGENLYYYEYVTNESYILGAPDSNDATLGQNTPTQRTGTIVVELNSSDAMPADQQFTVFAGGSAVNESYSVSVSEDGESDLIYLGGGYDQDDYVFTTPSIGSAWRYIHLSGTSGGSSGTDGIYGPEIDAVGWDKP